MYQDNVILCVSNKYERKYYLNPDFDQLPQPVKDELKSMCVIYTEEIGGILTLSFDDDGNLSMTTDAEENDLLYDEIGSVLKIKQLRRQKSELFESLETYFRVFFLGEDE
ncbi:MAG: DUF6145 family protein [Lachnospiraceae bacterium]|nr:DUF6145 family protein [Lachnospiraceae bacterium]